MGREGPQGCVLVHMCVPRKKVGGVDIQEALDRELECQSSLLCMLALCPWHSTSQSFSCPSGKMGMLRNSLSGFIRSSKQVDRLPETQHEAVLGLGL